jgi:GNAT superfamily N-acetyltransferase
VSPSHQRQGIGKQLLEKFLEEVDRDGEPVFLNASSYGKPLYEKYGWTTLKVNTYDLAEYGQPEGYTNTAMRREGKKKEQVSEIA